MGIDRGHTVSMHKYIDSIFSIGKLVKSQTNRVLVASLQRHSNKGEKDILHTKSSETRLRSIVGNNPLPGHIMMQLMNLSCNNLAMLRTIGTSNPQHENSLRHVFEAPQNPNSLIANGDRMLKPNNLKINYSEHLGNFNIQTPMNNFYR